jgi:TonB-dependent starch-binding outer membrane protein SusC
MVKLYLFKNWLIVLLLLVSSYAWAQTRVTGKVTSGDDGSALPGVSILEKGTTNGTVTDVNGSYSINTGENAVLVFSFVGFTTQEVPVAGRSAIDITLAGDVTALTEVVVIGYGELQKKDVTGSIVAIDTKDFNRGVIASPQDLLVGKVAGLQVTSNNGAPGSGSTIRIRGGSSLKASNDPLIVIDGFPVDNSVISGSPNALATINPNDIESFTVLKDASATAIYGSRASNGVIIITTKKGKQDKFQLSYNGTVGVSSPIDYIDVLSGDELRARATQLESEGFSGLNDAALARLGDENTDWQREVYRDAISTDHNLTASGAFKSVPYRISYGYTLQEGILKSTDMKRNTIGLNLNPTLLNDNLTVNANLKTSFSKHDFGNTDAIGAAVAYDPTQPVMNGNSKFGGYFTWTQLSDALADGSNNPEGNRNPIGVANPVALIDQTDNTSDVKRTIANLQLDYRLPFLPALRLNVNGGFDYSKGEGIKNYDPDAGFIGQANQFRTDYGSKIQSKLLETYFNYRRDLGKHGVDFTAGYSWQHFEREGFNFRRSIDETEVSENSRYKNENFLVSFFGRLNYTLNDRYLVTASLRNDGSSRFAESNRWGLFPAVALAWNISQESFLRTTKSISNLKLRLGYGVTGQQDITDNQYPFLATYRASEGGASYQFGNTFYQTLRPGPYDVNIKWEETTTYNIGLDFGFFEDRISGAVEFYQRETKDLINFIPIAAGSNFSNYLLTNVGDLENKGFEITLNAKAVQTDDIDWNIGFNFSRNKNKITKLTSTDDPNYPGVSVGTISGGVGNTIQKHQVGYPAFTFYAFEQVYDTDGRPIENLYVDRTGTGGNVTGNELNKYYGKKPAPDVMMGINSSFRYKKFDLYLSGRVSLGNYAYNNMKSSRAVYEGLYNQSGFFNSLPRAINDTEFVKPQYFSDYYIENASFFKMDNMSAGYNFDKVFSEKIKARISFTVQNAFTITDYSGLDPELDVPLKIGEGLDPGPGIDNNYYPRPRTFLLGVNLTF